MPSPGLAPERWSRRQTSQLALTGLGALLAVAALSAGAPAGRLPVAPRAGHRQPEAAPATAAVAGAAEVLHRTGRPATVAPRGPKPAPRAAAVAATRRAVPGSSSRPRTAGPRLAWGLYTPAFPGDPGAITTVSRQAGRSPGYVMWYVHWGGPWSGFDPADVTAVLSRGAIPVITWMSNDPGAPGAPGYTDAEIAAGSQDAYLRRWADALRAVHGTVLLRLDPEMNGNWEPWSPGVDTNTAAGYVAAWRHVRAVFAAAGVHNVQWVWSPNVGYPGSTPLPEVFPGASEVNLVGLDGYNWGTVDGKSWQSPAAVFATAVAQISALTDKPLLLTEVGSAGAGGNKATWMDEFFRLLRSTPRIRGFIYFDANKETDWRYSSSPAVLAAFRAGLASWLSGTG